MTGNEHVNNQGNINFSATSGGEVDHNKIHQSYGQGIQGGGNSSTTAGIPQTLDHNLIYHVAVSASTGAFNGIDCNGVAPDDYTTNITIYDTYANSLNLETGCTTAHVVNDIFDQNSAPIPATTGVSQSNLLYVDKMINPAASSSTTSGRTERGLLLS